MEYSLHGIPKQVPKSSIKSVPSIFHIVFQRIFVFCKFSYAYLLDRLLVLVNLSFHSQLFLLLIVTVTVISIIIVIIIVLVAIIVFPIINIIITMVITVSISPFTFSLFL